MAHLDERDVFAKTVFAEARGEPYEGQQWVAEVIKNRALANKGYWGGSSIKGVCLQPYQFECWNGVSDIGIPDNERHIYDNIRRMTDEIYNRHGGNHNVPADHYNNPAKEGYPAWTQNCHVVRVIANHTFYKSNC